MASLETNFNVSPYYDDYNEEKNFHRVLFRPAVPIQARELTQLQTILQNQVERFGDNIYKQGTIIQGCTFSYDYNYQYIKIKDLQVDGQTAIPSDYVNLYATHMDSGLNSIVVNYANGLESQDPDTNILFVKYLNTGTDEKKVFSNNTIIRLFNQDYRLNSVRIDGGGSNYSNSDFLVFTGGGGTGAAANIITYSSNGSIRSVVFSSYGTGYTSAPSVTINTSTGSGATLVPLNYVAEVTVLNDTFTAPSTRTGASVSTKPVGVGTAVTVSDGVIYQKGHFVRVEEQTVVVDKFTPTPNNLVLGFYTQESIVNSSLDSTLLDNAQGYSNYTAPGAHRLKLTPEVVVLTKPEAEANNEFFRLVEFEGGRVTKRKTETEFNSVNKKLAQRTAEESGDYVVNPFTITTEDIAGNTSHMKVVVGPGIAYVDGNRIEINDSVRVNAQQGRSTAVSSQQSIATNYGNYVLIKQVHGVFNFTSGATVTLRNTAATDVNDNFGGTSTSPGSSIGTAQIRSIQYDSGVIGTPDAVYRLYLFNIVMSSGQLFASVRSIQGSGAIADTVLNSSSQAVLTDTTFDRLLFPSGYSSVKSISNSDFVYRTVSTSTIQTNGNTTIVLSGDNEFFPYTPSQFINTVQEKDFIVIPTANAIGVTPLSGTCTSSGTTITGSGTANFAGELDVGEYVKFSGNNEIFRVTGITNSTSMTVGSTSGAGPNPTLSGANTITKAFPANIPIRLERINSTVLIDSTGKQADINISDSITGSTAVSVIHDVKISNNTVSLFKSKTVNKDVYVKISTDKLGDTTVGPWCLGIPDAFKIKGVYVGTSNTYDNTTTNYSSSFELITGQTDNVYGLSYLRYKPGSRVALSSDSCLLVKLDCFTHGSGYFITPNSYPVDDDSVTLPSSKIRTYEIPVFKSPKTGEVYRLRDVLDFRPIVTSTASATATTVAGATIDPSSIETLSGSLYFPTPNEIFEADVERYLPRTDLVVLDRNENITVKEGISSDRPVPPPAPEKSMVLATLLVPPYPSLSPVTASRIKRKEFATLVKTDQVQRYTMKDIKQIETRLKNLEYYSLLNTLEQDTNSLVIPSESDPTINRFKNGYFVDSFVGYAVSDVDNNEYNFLVDTRAGLGYPPIKSTSLKLKYHAAGSSGVEKKGDTIFLDYDHEVALNQDLATRVRNLAALAWSYNGQLKLFPEYDNFYDDTEQAINFTVDLATPLNDLINTINDSVVFNADSRTLTGVVPNGQWITVSNPTSGALQQPSQTSSAGILSRTEETQGSASFSVAEGNINTGTNVQDTTPVGNFSAISDFNVFIRGQEIFFCVVGLRPGMRHYVFFDKVRVDNSRTDSDGFVFAGARQGSIDVSLITSTASLDDNPDFSFTKSRGSSLVANSTGGLAGSFIIPSGKFFVGQREILIMDVDDIDSVDSSISRATANFNAYNFNRTNVSLTQTLVAPSSISPSVTRRTITENVTLTRTVYYDPLAQTFNINFEDGADGCYLTKVDLYFRSKPTGTDAAGLTVAIRETDNGYPSSVTLERKSVSASQVNVSNNATAVTTITFDNPVFIRNNKDYALVLSPDANDPNYRIWTAETGQPDVSEGFAWSGRVAPGDFGAGVLFISSNDKVWTPIQTEDLKMRIYYAKFSGTSGTAVFRNDNYEFLTLSGVQGSFVVGEKVAQKATSYITSATITGDTSSTSVTTSASLTSSISAGDMILLVYGKDKVSRTGTVSNTSLTTITGSGTNFVTDFDVGDHILIGNDIREITAIANSSQLTIDASLRTAASGASYFSVTESYQVNKVSSINATTIVFTDIPELTFDNTATFANMQKVVSGKVYQIDNDDTVIISDSSASDSTYRFQSLRKIVGSTSDASATIKSVDDRIVNYVEPHLSTLSPTPTSISLTSNIARVSGSSSTQPLSFGVSNKTAYEAEIRSRSNEIFSHSGSKSLVLTATLGRTTGSDKVSPAVHTNPASVVVMKNEINNITADKSFNGRTSVSNTNDFITLSDNVFINGDIVRYLVAEGNTAVSGLANNLTYYVVSSNSSGIKLSSSLNGSAIDLTSIATSETGHRLLGNNYIAEAGRYGSALTKYISKQVKLADGLDAEDMKVYITAYKPPSTNILVYGKILSNDDPTNFSDRDWTLLSQDTESNLYSDLGNESDYIEYEYSFPESSPSSRKSGRVATNSNTTITGTSTTFSSDFVQGDLVKIVNLDTSTDYEINIVSSVTNNTLLTLSNAGGPYSNTTTTGLTIEKVDQPGAAFKYSQDGGVVRYYNPTQTVISFNANTGVSNTDDFITITNNSFQNNMFVKYSTALGNTALTNLSNNQSYFVVSSNSSGVKLSSTYNGSAINLTSGISESGHTLTANTAVARKTYIVFALKIVLLSSTTQRVPRLSDVRALAVSV